MKLRDLEHVTSIVATHQIRDAFYVASRDAATALAGAAIPVGVYAQATHAIFMVLHEGRVYFEGNADELRNSRDPYLQEFLYMTLPPW